MVVVRLDGARNRQQKAGTVSIVPTDNDIWALEIRMGLALTKGDFVTARFERDRFIELRKAFGRPVEAAKPRKFSRVDQDAIAIARAWMDGQGDNAKWLAEQLARKMAKAR